MVRVDLTPLQRVTLYRLAEGGADPVYQPRIALRWLRRYGLLDADHQVTDEGREELARIIAARRHAARSRRPQEPDPTGGMRDAIRRWKAGDRDW